MWLIKTPPFHLSFKDNTLSFSLIHGAATFHQSMYFTLQMHSYWTGAIDNDPAPHPSFIFLAGSCYYASSKAMYFILCIYKYLHNDKGSIVFYDYHWQFTLFSKKLLDNFFYLGISNGNIFVWMIWEGCLFINGSASAFIFAWMIPNNWILV